MAYVSNIDSPSKRLEQGIRERVNAFGDSPRVFVELDKMSYVPGFRKKYDAVQYVYDSVVSDLLSIDKAEKLTNYVDGTPIDLPTELRNSNMSMPVLMSSTLSGHKNDELHIHGMRITDWFETDSRCSRKKHKGIDLDLAIGDRVHSVWQGTVTYAQTNGGYGKVVYVDHGDGWQTRYAHLSDILVNKGQRVSPGTVVGLGGNSGLVISSGGGDGSHLHFEVRKDNTPLNPEPFLRGKKVIQTPSKAPSTIPKLSSSESKPLEYHMEATAYTATCSGCTGITKGGTDVRVWNDWKIIAVDPSVIPLKSKVELIVDGVSWGEYLADDTGGAIKGHRIDILMETNDIVRKFGRKPVQVRVKSWGDGKSRDSRTDTAGDHSLGKEIVTYQLNKTTTQQTYFKDFSKKTSLDPNKFKDHKGVEQFFIVDDGEKMNVLGFQKTTGAGARKSFTFEHDWFKAGNLGWAYFADLEIDDVIHVKVDDYMVATIKGINSKHGIAYPPSIPIPKGNHKIEFSLSNPSKASIGKFGLLYLKAREFDVQTVEKKQIWDFQDPMNSTNNWTSYGPVIQQDKGSYQSIGTRGGQAGIERLNKITKFPLTLNFKVKMSEGTDANIFISNGKKNFLVYLKKDKIFSAGGGSYTVDNATEFVEYTIVCHDETDMDVYIKKNETWINTGIRGVAYDYPASRLLFSVSNGTIFLDEINYAFSDYAIEQFATHIANTYKDKWYEIGEFVFDEMFTINADIISWEVNTHLDMASSTARVTLNNAKGIYSPTWERKPEFPETYRTIESPYTYYEEGELRHVISEGTPIRIYAGYGEEVVRVFTGTIKGEIEEDAEKRILTFNCVDRFDMLEEFVFYKSMSYPPEEALAGDNGAFAWLKSSIIEDIAVAAGMTTWKVHAEDIMNPDYIIEDTVYIDVNKGQNTFMKFNKETGELEAVSQEAIMSVGGWQNPFVASVTFPIGTRATDAIASLLQDIPYRVYCDRYGTFRLEKMDFLNYPDWSIHATSKWEFVDSENLLSLTSSTDYSGVRNHLMISGSSGMVEHFFDKSLIVATKGNIRTAGIQQDWIIEKDGASMRGAKEAIANKLFFDIKRRARTKNVAVKGNPLIEVLDAVYVVDRNTYTANHYLVKGNRLAGDSQGIINYLELTWQTLT